MRTDPAQGSTPTPLPAPAATLPQICQPWPGIEGSAYAGVTTGKDGVPYALVVLADRPLKRLSWPGAIDWAHKFGADLPSRAESALLYANVSDQFEKDWHWTNEQYSAGSAFGQYFYDGSQYDYGKEALGCVRAVRRFPLDPLILQGGAT